MFTLVPLIIFFPLAGLLINLLFGKQFAGKGPGIIASAAALTSFLIAVLQFVALQGHPEGAVVHLADWITVGDLEVPWAFQVDTLSVTMMLVVTGVGSLITIYAVGYMQADVQHHHDPGRYPRFFIYFNLFLASMLILVTGSSYLTLFVGWEGVGLCSFLLIGFWHESSTPGIGSNATAARKAFVVNRIGDFGFLIALFLLFATFGTLNFDEIFPMAMHVADADMPFMVGGLQISFSLIITLITLFLLLGATGKSAQIPLYVWLPDAMAGPTPVSALIHAATMVTAGIYMITRSAALFDLAPASQAVVALIGAGTAIWAGSIGVGQFDIKRVLAFSTISQLGFMIAAVGLGAYIAGMFHLVTHAFFKALLFLSSGSVIQGLERGHHAAEHAPHREHYGEEGEPAHPAEPLDPQDMRNMGGLRDRMRTTFWVYTLGALALAGVFPLAGFWSKDEILADAWHVGLGEGAEWQGLAAFLLLTVAAFFTAFYMGRQIFMVFFGSARTEAARHASESPRIMTYPLIALAFLSVVGGFLNFPKIGSLEIAGFTEGFGRWLEHTNEAFHGLPLNPVVALLSTFVALAAIYAAYRVYSVKPMATGEHDPLERYGRLFIALNRKLYVDEAYAFLFVNPYNRFSVYLADVIDGRFWHDWFHDSLLARGFNSLTAALAQGVDTQFIDGLANGLADLTKGAAARLRRLQTGFVRNYALTFLAGVVVILAYLLLR